MISCGCEQPVRHPTPMRRHTCVKCGLQMDPAWESNDANLMAFTNRLTDCQTVPPTIASFIAHCEAREKAGRDHFGFLYLKRDNIAEGLEEACDLGLYPYLDILQAKRRGEDGEDGIDLALTVAYHASQAYDALLRLRERRGGAA